MLELHEHLVHYHKIYKKHTNNDNLHFVRFFDLVFLQMCKYISSGRRQKEGETGSNLFCLEL